MNCDFKTLEATETEGEDKATFHIITELFHLQKQV